MFGRIGNLVVLGRRVFIQLGRNLLYLRHFSYRHLDVFLGLPLGLRHRRFHANGSVYRRQLCLFRLCIVPHLRRHCGVRVYRSDVRDAVACMRDGIFRFDIPIAL